MFADKLYTCNQHKSHIQDDQESLNTGKEYDLKYLNGADHGAECKDRGAILDGGLRVKGALCVHHEDNDIVSRGQFPEKRLIPQENARSVAVRAAAPVESRQFFRVAPQPSALMNFL